MEITSERSRRRRKKEERKKERKKERKEEEEGGGGGGGGGGEEEEEEGEGRNKGKKLLTREVVFIHISGPIYSSRLCIYLVIYCNIELDKSIVTYVTI